MKKIAYFAVILVLAILTVFAGRDDADLFSGRKPVGKLTIYTSMSEDVIKSLDTDLKKQFPDCKICNFFHNTPPLKMYYAVSNNVSNEMRIKYLQMKNVYRKIHPKSEVKITGLR